MSDGSASRSLPPWLILAAALLAAAVLTVTALAPYPGFTDNPATGIPVLAVCVTISLALGLMVSWRLSLIGMLPLAVAVTANSSGVNSFLAALVVGPWLCGLLIGSQRRLAKELRRRSVELEAEQHLLAVHAVRYERAQIARELHDVVAHSVSLIVVQANAGAYLASKDPQAAAEAFDSIGAIAAQARTEVEYLATVLDDPAEGSTDAGGLGVIEDLVRRVETSGLAATCQFTGDLGAVSGRLTETLLRLVQESIANSVKHAPGAPICLVLHGAETSIELEVTNPAATSPPSGLEHLGGGRGLVSMRERVNRCGGTFTAGQTADGGWRISAVMPRHPGRPAVMVVP
jgi:signal transduction histidine kinase